MTTSDDDFTALSGLVTGYFHQDMDLEYESIPQALAGYAGLTEESTKQQLRREMETFLERYHNDLEGEFSRRYWFDFTPEVIGQTVPEFFDMVRTILADPESYLRFEPRS
ncbi:contact-dependent growth inhibition system immunity protein [uncultured Agrobacterium sp.]|uniref:contact-dependent growth inhibition system immunity protein n=1 Tax=uncultured Agrobacterium sp. TaxID=157277 RepID=UPI00258DBE70|nr:contact-dependent growth inhibition system immunity protein [uncultured Agrobacterium sp.]